MSGSLNGDRMSTMRLAARAKKNIPEYLQTLIYGQRK